MKEKTLYLIEEYHKSLINLLYKILDNFDIRYNKKENINLFLENFWKLYSNKEISRAGTFFLEDETIEYNFHGSGCHFKGKYIEIESNFYNSDNQFTINFGVDILWNYITYNRLISDDITREILFNNLELLYRDKKILRSFYPPFYLYHYDLEEFIF